MKWNIFHFSLDPLPPLRSEIPSYFWLHYMMVNTSPVRCKPIFFWRSEIVTMKSPTPFPLVKNSSLHWLQGIFETVPNHFVLDLDISIGWIHGWSWEMYWRPTESILEMKPWESRVLLTMVVVKVGQRSRSKVKVKGWTCFPHTLIIDWPRWKLYRRSSGDKYGWHSEFVIKLLNHRAQNQVGLYPSDSIRGKYLFGVDIGLLGVFYWIKGLWVVCDKSTLPVMYTHLLLPILPRLTLYPCNSV